MKNRGSGKNNVYYTSICTLNYLVSCMVFIGIILLVYTGNGPVVDGLMIVLESIFFTAHMRYIFRGIGNREDIFLMIEDRNRETLLWIAGILVILCILYYISPTIKEITILAGIIVIIIYYGICFTCRRMNGDNAVKAGDEIDYLYFSRINEKLINMKVIFPMDISHNRNSMKEGRIKEAGKMLCGKYMGEPVFLLERENGYYICPIKRVHSLELPEGDDNILAGNEEVEVALLRYEKGRYKSSFFCRTKIH